MFMIIAASLSAIIVLYLLMRHGRQSKLNDNRYRLVCELRSVAEHLREHRHLAHTHLSFEPIPDNHTVEIEKNISNSLLFLVEKSFVNDRPMFRLLMKQIQTLLFEWRDMTASKSQMSHGKAIRATLYLIDEIVLTWLVESDQLELSEQYSRQWSHVIDSLEALTQFRMLVSDSRNELQCERLNLKAQVLLRKINRLSLLSPLGVHAPSTSHAARQLTEIISAHGHIEELDERELYQLTSTLSLAIFKVYDQILIELSEQLNQPLPAKEVKA
ncbi:hypothetical protein [Vibrio superstes]|uniref:Nitrate/nitrite sensing protein domain-containing protein n=1 Tax=Vibrio superstes NBRC 103154 TaxID=1219062 RepID=A0A511QRI6_9VIBR|nr:hypothetical protein [Vibrio superstes]GEM79943.1 hypothetical protein VSU01S_21880 [Vibrio superstes NBRC 103154]